MRDKLIEILQQKYDHYCDQCGVNKDTHYIENLADYLIAHGVTFATDNNVLTKRIPANERLPVKVTRVDFAKCEGCHWRYAPDDQTDCWVCKDNDHYVEGK